MGYEGALQQDGFLLPGLASGHAHRVGSNVFYACFSADVPSPRGLLLCRSSPGARPGTSTSSSTNGWEVAHSWPSRTGVRKTSTHSSKVLAESSLDRLAGPATSWPSGASYT